MVFFLWSTNCQYYLSNKNYEISVITTTKGKHRFELLNDNINTVYFDFTENEREALDELLRLPFYHGIVEEITEVKYL